MEQHVIGGIFEAGGLLRASSAAGLETWLRREPGIETAEANPVSQTVAVRFDETVLKRIRLEGIRRYGSE